MIWLKQTEQGLRFKVYIQPRASRTAIVGIHQEALKIKLTSPPAGGAANKHCIAVLAKALSLPKSAIHIVSGQTSRMKQILVRPISNGFTPSQIETLKHALKELAGSGFKT